MHDPQRSPVAAAALVRVIEPGGCAGDHGQGQVERDPLARGSRLRE